MERMTMPKQYRIMELVDFDTARGKVVGTLTLERDRVTLDAGAADYMGTKPVPGPDGKLVRLTDGQAYIDAVGRLFRSGYVWLEAVSDGATAAGSS